MNPIIDIKDELTSALLGRLKDDADPKDLVSTIAAMPRFSLGAHPRSAADATAFVTAAERKLDKVAKPRFNDDVAFERARREIAATLESHLLEEYVPGREFREEGWPDEIRFLLRDYPPHYRHEAAHHVANLARFESDADVPNGVVDPLVSNLGVEEAMVRRSSARALADLADSDPERVAPVISRVVPYLIADHEEIQCDLLYTLGAVAESAAADDGVDLSDDELLTLVRTAQYTLIVYTDDRLHVLATRLLAVLAPVVPELVVRAAYTLRNRVYDTHPAVGDHAQVALKELSAAGVLDEEAFSYRPDELLEFIQSVCDPTVVQVEIDNLDIELADQGLTETGTEQGEKQSRLPFHDTDELLNP